MRTRLARDGALRRLAWRSWRRTRTAAAQLTADSRTLPSFLIIGAQRAGTTSLHHYLAEHPSLVPPVTTKGVHWFDIGWDRSPSWYRAHFPRTEPGQRTFESSPYYLFHPHVPARATSMLPDLRVIAVLRDPVERLWSHYHHVVAKGLEDLSFDQAIAAEDERLRDAEDVLRDPYAVHEHHQHHAYVARSTYAPQVARWIDTLGRDRVLLIDSSELRATPQACVDVVTDFLGVPRHAVQPAVAHNARQYDRLDDDRRHALRRRFEESDRQLRDLTGRTFSWMDR